MTLMGGGGCWGCKIVFRPYSDSESFLYVLISFNQSQSEMIQIEGLLIAN